MGRALIVLQTDQDRETACRWARGVPLGSRIEFKETKRSLPQNDLMWALLTEVSQQLKHGDKKYDPDQWKSIFLHAFGREITFLPSLDLKTFLPIELSSSDLGKDEMTNFIEFILKEGTERGVTFREHSSESPSSEVLSPDASGSDDADTSPRASSDEPAGSSSAPAGSDQSEPSLFGKFNFAEGELVDLKDLARKALDDAAGDSDAPAKEAAISRLFDGYADVIESSEGRSAMTAMGVPIAAVVNGKRSRGMAADYIARDLLGCPAEQLEGRK